MRALILARASQYCKCKHENAILQHAALIEMEDETNLRLREGLMIKDIYHRPEL